VHLGDERRGRRLVERSKFPDIRAAAEDLAVPPEHDDAQASLLPEAFEPRGELIEHARIERIDLLRPVEEDARNPTALLELDHAVIL